MDILDKIKKLANGILDNSISIQEQEDYNEDYEDGYKSAMQDILYRIEQH
jgi:hypothetical protein